MSTDAKALAHFFNIVNNWRPISDVDAVNPNLLPAWQVLQTFPEAMEDYGHWIDEFKLALTTPRVLMLSISVPHSKGHTEPFVVLLDLDNSRIFATPARTKFQLILDFYNQTRDPMTEDELIETIQDTIIEAVRRMGIVVAKLAEDLKVPPMAWDQAPRLVHQYRPMAFYTTVPQEAVAFLDVIVLTGADKAWYDHVWALCKAYQSHPRAKSISVTGEVLSLEETQALDNEINAAVPPAQPPNPKVKTKSAVKVKIAKSKKPNVKAPTDGKRKRGKSVKQATRGPSSNKRVGKNKARPTAGATKQRRDKGR